MRAWATALFLQGNGYFFTRRSDDRSGFKGFEKLLLLSWLIQKLQEMDNGRFALHYWDLRPNNILVNDNKRITLDISIHSG
jgi:hypothetical protein